MASKSGNGCIMQMEKGKAKGKCRKWRLRVACGFDPYANKYVEKTRVFHGTYSEAQKALREFIDEIESGTIVQSNNWTLKDYSKHYMDTREMSGNIAPGSIKRDRDRMDSLCFLIGHIKLQKITPTVLEKTYADMRNGKSKSGKNLSGTYVFKIHKVLSTMLKDAVNKGIIASNPCEKATPPKMDTKEKRALEPAKVKEVLGMLDPTHHGQLGIMLCLTLGLRRGEVVGLSWEDVSFDDGTVYVCHSYDDAGSMNVPKTKSSFRLLPMADTLRDGLLARKAYLIKAFEKRCPERLVKDEEGNVTGFVPGTAIICDNFGVRIKPSGLDQWWRKHRSQFGLDGITLHELRHTFLTLAAKQGVHPSVMQKLAGHSSAQVTMEIYTHVNMDAKRDAMKAMQQIF